MVHTKSLVIYDADYRYLALNSHDYQASTSILIVMQTSDMSLKEPSIDAPVS